MPKNVAYGKKLKARCHLESVYIVIGAKLGGKHSWVLVFLFSSFQAYKCSTSHLGKAYKCIRQYCFVQINSTLISNTSKLNMQAYILTFHNQNERVIYYLGKAS